MKPPALILSGARRAFTLVEMLVVVGIVTVLATLSVPALRSMTESANLTTGGQLVASQFNLARQIASARNCNVAVRLPLSTAATGGAEHYRGMELWIAVSGTGGLHYQQITRHQKLPDGIVIAGDSARSPVLNSGVTVSGLTTGGDQIDFALCVAPSGRVTPALAMSEMFLTVIPERAADHDNIPDRAIIQLHPDTGTEVIYRP